LHVPIINELPASGSPCIRNQSTLQAHLVLEEAFTGFSSVLRDIINGGYFVSATPAAEYHEEHRRAVKEAPLHRLLLETDCSVTYGRVTRYESQPVDILRSMEAVSQLKEIDGATIAGQTTRNAIDFFL
jgi:TatD DNase family protein